QAGRADLAIAPLALPATLPEQTAGLRAQPLGAPIPNPALVLLTPPAIALAERLRAALPAIKLEGPYSGLRASTGKAYPPLATELAGNAPWQHRAPVLPAPRPPLPHLPALNAPDNARHAAGFSLPPTRALIGF